MQPGGQLLAAITASLLSLVGALPVASPADAAYGPFAKPEPVQILGYPASAEEPFITPDGRYLLFNSSEAEPVFTLQYATALNAQTFEYDGDILGEGVNEAGSLSGTPTLDTRGNLYFVSPRSYAETLSTIYTGNFSNGTVTGVHLVPGVSGARVGLVDFDVGVSPDGSSLYVSVGQFGGPESPSSATIVLYGRVGAGSFMEASDSAMVLKAVNETAKLNYGAAITGDGLELFYTAATPALGIAPSVYRAIRANTDEAFGAVEKIGAITGFAEAPAITSDGETLYYHEKVGPEVQVMDVMRPLTTASVKLTKLIPTRGSAAGGTTVRIKGSNLTGVTAVAFGASPASGVHVDSPSEATAVSPPGSSGEASVTVTGAEGTSEPTTKARFDYSSPSVSEVSPREGSFLGETLVTLHGSGFSPGAGITGVLFGSVLARDVECASTTTCTVSSPQARRIGPVAVSVISGGRRSKRREAADEYTYAAP